MPDDIEDVTYPEEYTTGEYTDTTTTTSTTTTSTTTTSTTTTTTVVVTTTKPVTTTKAATTTKPVTTTSTVAPATTSSAAPVTTTSKAPVTTSSGASVSTSSLAPVTESSVTASTTPDVDDPNNPVDPVDPADPVEPPLRPIVIDGEFETAFDWDEELADKDSEAYKEKFNTLESDLKNILGADEDIETVELTECTFTEAGVEAVVEPEAPAVEDIAAETVVEPETPAVEDIAADPARRRRQAEEVLNKAHADFKVKVTSKSADVAEAAARETITAADPDTFPSLSENSASTYVLQEVTYVDPIPVTISPATASSQKLRIAISIMGVLAVLIL